MPSDRVTKDRTVQEALRRMAKAVGPSAQGFGGVVGEQGPEGPTGPAGATGATGPQGETGPAGAGAFVPTFIAFGDTFTVPEHMQALFALTIDNEGTLDVIGDLVMVD